MEPLLTQLGVAEAVVRANFLCHKGTWVEWDKPRRFEPFGADAAGPWRGFQAWRADFDSLLLRQAEQLGVCIRQPCRPLHPLVEDGRVVGVVTTDDGPTRARFVIDAAGGQHWLVRHLALEICPASPPLACWYSYAEGTCPQRDAAPALVADPTGWTWTARVRPGTYAWTRLSLLPRKGEGPQIDKHWLPEEFKGLRSCGNPRGANVTWRIVSQTAGAGYFLVGDAAAVLDPVSSHGVLKAIMSGMLAAHFTATCMQQTGHESNESEVAEGYGRWMQDWFQHDVKKLRELYTLFPGIFGLRSHSILL